MEVEFSELNPQGRLYKIALNNGMLKACIHMTIYIPQFVTAGIPFLFIIIKI
ncbi:hypothetical protein KEH51_04410 [[Brevibacterium] frigoritolerans]|uniref:Uncharacterized protein n=1 Tax=Peribacillus frigoritolerans TaxID=450367 RepID=A0A941FPC2_9BACI|nr:hypothetical protein [Peribacillus frigoritolerans]